MRTNNHKKTRNGRGSSIVETCAGLFVVIPILLFFMDIGYVVIGQMANDGLAKEAARAAAETNDLTGAQATTAANNVATNYFSSEDSMFISPPGGFSSPDTAIANVQYNPTVAGVQSGVVIVTTNIVCKVPCPFPGFPNPLQFSATATEPIVALLPTN
jgi:hypothetical protein